MNEQLQTIAQRAEPVLRKGRIARAGVFGSCAQGTARQDSDIDLLVEYPLDYSLFDVVDLKQALEEVLGRRVDLVGYDAIKPQLRDSVLASQVTIY